MRYLDLDANNTQGSDVDEGYQSVNAGQSINPDVDYDATGTGTPVSDFDDSGYQSPNQDQYKDPNFQNSFQNAEAERSRQSLIQQAQRGYKRARARVQRTAPKRIGENLLGDKQAFMNDTPENRERVKAEAKERASKYIKEQVGDKLEGKIAKEAGKKVAEQAGKKAAQKAGEVAAEQAVKQGGKLAVKGGEKAFFKIAEAAAGPETLGLGTVAIWLLEVAVNLGISDAVDALFELKNGNIKQASFHAVKAIYLVVMFVVFLVIVILSITVVGLIVTIIPIILLNIYVVMGLIFPGNPALQGFSRKWEIAALFLLDMFVVVMIVTIAAGVLYGICTQTAIGSLIGWTGIIGDAINYLDTNYGTGGAIAGLNQACAAVQSFR